MVKKISNFFLKSVTSITQLFLSDNMTFVLGLDLVS